MKKILELFKNLTVKQIDFDIRKNWFVFFRIQKTGGTNFDRDFIKNVLLYKHGKYKNLCQSIRLKQQIKKSKLDRTKPRNAANLCHRPNSGNNKSFYLSWHIDFGWRCGLHPDLVDLKNCVFKNYTSNQKDFLKSKYDEIITFKYLIDNKVSNNSKSC